MSSNIKNKVKKKKIEKSKDWSKYFSKFFSGFGWWMLISIIILSNISLTSDNNIIKFLYPKNINEINITSKHLKDNSALINLIKEINEFSISDCKVFPPTEQEKTSGITHGGGGARPSIQSTNPDSVVGSRKKNVKNNIQNKITGLLAIIKVFIYGMDTEYFKKYLQYYNCELIRTTLRFQNKYINSILEEANDLFKVKDNDKKKYVLFKKLFSVIWNYILPFIVFILKPIGVFILGYLKFVWTIIELTFEEGGYGFTGKLIFSFINGFIMFIFVFIMFIIQILIHIFTFTLLPLFIIKSDSDNSLIHIFGKNFIPLIILLLLFLRPFFIYLFN